MELGKLEYLISVNKSQLDSGIQNSEKEIKKFGDKLSAWTVAKGQMIARLAERAASSAASMIKSTVKSAVDAYANFEQLEGGVKKIFGSDFQKVMNNASKAFKTTGISANEYMQTVTEFSSALIQGLSGDTAKAADIADQALIDMADNANTFGSSMESIMNAYRGFSKQNYTMLDNLKLGYGGTKTEMQRLLKDAEKLTGVKYDIKNLGDVYNAIHAIQVEMKVAGTTQKEAEGTISGSISSMKAAWQDLLVSIGSGRNLSTATRNLSKSLRTVIKNVRPVVMNSIKNLFKVAKDIFPDLKALVKDTFKEVKVSIADWVDLGSDASWWDIGTKILGKLGGALKRGGSSLMTTIFGSGGSGGLLDKVFNPTTISKFMGKISEIITGIATWIKNSPDKFAQIVTSIAQAITTAAPIILDAITSLFKDEQFKAAIGQLIQSLIEAAKGTVKVAIDAGKLAAEGLADSFGSWIDKETGAKEGTGRQAIEAALLGYTGFKVGQGAYRTTKYIAGKFFGGKTTLTQPTTSIPQANPVTTSIDTSLSDDVIDSSIDDYARSLSEMAENAASTVDDVAKPRTIKDIVKNAKNFVSNKVKGASLKAGAMSNSFNVNNSIIAWDAIQQQSSLARWGQRKLADLTAGIVSAVIGEDVKPHYDYEGFEDEDPFATLKERANGFVNDLNKSDLFWRLLGIVSPVAPYQKSYLHYDDVPDKFGETREQGREKLAKAIEFAKRNANGEELGIDAWLHVTGNEKEMQDEANKYSVTIPAYLSVNTSDLPNVGYWHGRRPVGGGSTGANYAQDVEGTLEHKAKGDWDVHYDQLAMLHQGEMVLTKSQARKYRDGESGFGVETVGTLVANAVDRAMSKVYVMMSGEKVGDLTTRRVKNNMNAASYRKLRALGG